jgi:hypothetical protein
MRIALSSTAFAFALVLGSIPLGSASAQDMELHLGNHGPRIIMRDDCDPRFKKHGGWASTALASSVWDAAASRFAAAQMASV